MLGLLIKKTFLEPVTRFHQDQRGAMSFVTLFTVLMLSFLLGMLLNVCKISDEKIRMQDATDAATYSSGVVMARGMNSLAFTNHLLCDVFALTAFLQTGSTCGTPEGPDTLALRITTAYLETGSSWPREKFGLNYLLPDLPRQNWGFTKEHLGVGDNNPQDGFLPESILFGARQNREMVQTFSSWAKNFSNEVLPSLQNILDRELIPTYQRMLTEQINSMVQETAQNIALRNLNGERNDTVAAIWRSDSLKSDGEQVDAWKFGDTPPDSDRIVPIGLPVVDPLGEIRQSGHSSSFPVDMSKFYENTARAQRKRLSEGYLAQWNQEKLLAFDHLDGMSQFTTIWRGTSKAKLKRLLEDQYPNSNLPHVIWTPERIAAEPGPAANKEDLRHKLCFNYSPRERNREIHDCYTFVGVVKKTQFAPFLPRLMNAPMFKNPLAGEQRMTFAQGLLYLPVPRLVYETFPVPCCDISITQPSMSVSNSDGTGISITPGSVSSQIRHSGQSISDFRRQAHSIQWNLLNQNWQFKLCPARHDGLKSILAKNEPAFDKLEPVDIRRLNTH